MFAYVNVSRSLPIFLGWQYLLLIFALFKLQFNFIFHKYGQKKCKLLEPEKRAEMLRYEDTSSRYFAVNCQLLLHFKFN